MDFNHRYNSSKISIPDNIESSIGTFTEIMDFEHFNFRQNSTKLKLVGLHTRGSKVLVRQDSSYKYYIDNSFPSLCFRVNNKAYYCAKSFQKEAVSSYQIPAGTYSPSDFKALIEQYISRNGSRACANDFTVTVNGPSITAQTKTVSKGTLIYNTAIGSSPFDGCQFVGFGQNRTTGTNFYQIVNATNGFINTGIFLTSSYCWNASIPPTEGPSYIYTMARTCANYSITVGTGINFN